GMLQERLEKGFVLQVHRSRLTALRSNRPPRSRPLRPPLRAQRPPSPLAPLAPTPPAGLRYGLRRRSLVLALLGPDGNSGKSEAEVVVPDRRREPVAVRRPAVGAEAAPAAAPAHPVRAQDGIRPFPDVAVKVVDAKAVRLVRAHFRRASQILPLAS